jgi:hypothetical protein
MKFTLIYDGPLRPTGNKSRPDDASTIRNQLHDQLADLWKSNIVFRQLAHTARTSRGGATWAATEYAPLELPDYDDPPPPLEPGQRDYCEPIPVPNVGSFIPAVRKSLHLACALDILFLRHVEPFNLLKSGGDLDNRILTLFDALKIPSGLQELGVIAPAANPLYVLLEDDALVCDLAIKSGKLLGRGETKKHEVRLTIDPNW